MSVGHFVTERLIGKLFVAWLAVLALAMIGAIYTSFSIVEIAGVIGMLGTLGILAIQAHEVSTKLDTIEEDEKSEKRESTSDSSENEDLDDSSSGQQVGAIEGSSATERRVQDELIREAYRQFAERPFTFWSSPQGEYLRNHLQDEFEDVDEEVIGRVWRFSKDDGFFKRRPGKRSLTVTPTALWQAEELDEDLLLDDAVQDEILDVLLQSYPRVNRGNLIEAVGRSPDVGDHNLWLLREKEYVEIQAYINSDDAGYSEVEITQLGRQVAE